MTLQVNPELHTQSLRLSEERLRRATLDHDISTLDELLHDAFVAITRRGSITKQEVLLSHAKKRLSLTRYDFVGEPIIEPSERFATVTVRALLEGTYDGLLCDGFYRYVRAWKRVGTCWKLLSANVKPEAS